MKIRAAFGLYALFLGFVVSMAVFYPHTAKAQDSEAPLMTLVEYAEALKYTNIKGVKVLMNENTLATFDQFVFSGDTMRKEAASIIRCGQGKVKINGSRAVVYFETKITTCSPYFMEFQMGKWRIDLYYMAKVIRFNDDDSWKIVANVEHPYKFMFRKKAKKK